jgi:hypothetical protein
MISTENIFLKNDFPETILRRKPFYTETNEGLKENKNTLKTPKKNGTKTFKKFGGLVTQGVFVVFCFNVDFFFLNIAIPLVN